MRGNFVRWAAVSPAVALAGIVALLASVPAASGGDVAAADPVPAPTVTVTVEPEAGPRGPGAIALIPADLDPVWQLAESAQQWNDATGCALFTLDTDGVDRAYAVVEDDELVLDGVTVWGLYEYDRGVISLNPDPGHKGVHRRVPMHELGHAAGLLERSDEPLDVMNVIEDNETVVPSQAEIKQVRQLHRG